jgi:hypothetical protein
MTINNVYDLKQLTLEELESDSSNMECAPTCGLFLRYGGATAGDRQPMEAGEALTNARLDEMRRHLRESLGDSDKLSSWYGLKGGDPASVFNFCAAVDDNPSRIFNFVPSSSTTQWCTSRHNVQRREGGLTADEIADITSLAISYLNEELAYAPRGVPLLIDNDSGTYHCVVYTGPNGDAIQYFDPDPQRPGVTLMSREEFAVRFWSASSFDSTYPGCYSSRTKSSPLPEISAGTELGELDVGGWWDVRLQAAGSAGFYKSASEAEVAMQDIRDQYSALIIENPRGIFSMVPINDVNKTPGEASEVGFDKDDSLSTDYLKAEWSDIASLGIHLGYEGDDGQRAYFDKTLIFPGRLTMRDMP